MNEVSTVTGLITRLIGIAIALGIAGTLVDKVFEVRTEAKQAITSYGISYVGWNNRLQKPDSKK